jgi:4-hydroxythreonine-4-phosphate dehydrogenase
MAQDKRPLALTLGDPAGIGPDITLAAWAAQAREPIPPFVLVGDAAVLALRAKTLGIAVPVRVVSEAGEAPAVFAEALPVLEAAPAPVIVAGRPDPAAAHAILDSIERAVALVQAGEARAIVTNPIAKSLLYAAGFGYPGHTEYLAALAAAEGSGPAPHPVMMLAAGGFRVVPATVHIPLKDVSDELTTELLLKVIEITAQDLRRFFGVAQPRLAVTGLNPHAGEDGSLGREEIEIVAPAIEAARARGIDATGPYPADTLFHTAARRGYDAAICMYHDQALVPFKTLAFEEGVNVTLGLPFVRTSPDHGTAFAIAGSGSANPRSLIEALRLADAMTHA